MAPKPPAHNWLFLKSRGVDANWADADTPIYKLDLAEFLRSLILSVLFCTLEILIAPTNGRIK